MGAGPETSSNFLATGALRTVARLVFCSWCLCVVNALRCPVHCFREVPLGQERAIFLGPKGQRPGGLERNKVRGGDSRRCPDPGISPAVPRGVFSPCFPPMSFPLVFLVPLNFPTTCPPKSLPGSGNLMRFHPGHMGRVNCMRSSSLSLQEPACTLISLQKSTLSSAQK